MYLSKKRFFFSPLIFSLSCYLFCLKKIYSSNGYLKVLDIFTSKTWVRHSNEYRQENFKKYLIIFIGLCSKMWRTSSWNGTWTLCCFNSCTTFQEPYIHYARLRCMGALYEKRLGREHYCLLWNSGIWNRDTDMYVGIYFYFCIRWDDGKVHEYSPA